MDAAAGDLGGDGLAKQHLQTGASDPASALAHLLTAGALQLRLNHELGLQLPFGGDNKAVTQERPRGSPIEIAVGRTLPDKLGGPSGEVAGKGQPNHVHPDTGTPGALLIEAKALDVRPACASGQLRTAQRGSELGHGTEQPKQQETQHLIGRMPSSGMTLLASSDSRGDGGGGGGSCGDDNNDDEALTRSQSGAGSD